MADSAAGAPPSDDGAAIVSEQLTALLLKDADGIPPTQHERRGSLSSFNIPPTPPSSLEVPSHLHIMREHSQPSRRPLFSSMREALESSGQVKEESGGYVIKRHSSRQQYRSAESTKSAKYRYAKPRPRKNDPIDASPEDEADAAGYTVIRRRSSCDESSSTPTPSATGRRNQRTSTAAHCNTNMKPQRPRRGSMSALPQSSSVMPPPSSSAPPGFQPRVQLRPPPGLWVAKAAAPAEQTGTLEEPPVEALWPEMKPTTTTQNGWAVTTTAASEAQAWPPPQQRRATRLTRRTTMLMLMTC